jgi:exopolysaccharide/PEP-CTERM locus tyrosine autokinase
MSVVERAIDKLRRRPEAEKAAGMAPSARESIGALVEAQDDVPSGPRIAIDRDAVRAAGYLPEQDQDRQFAEEYRQIKRPLLAASFAADAASMVPSPRLIMMASALPSDGKTFTSINLALSLARERDSSVVLVDADVAKPHISRIFGVQDSPGLLDALLDETLDVASLVLPTDVRGLSVLPAGKSREGAAEYLGSARMKEVVNGLIQRNPRCIALFDTSPLLVSSDARAVAALVGQVVLVVRAGKTPRQAVAEALASLGPEKSVGLVLNQGRRSLTEGLYGYGTYGTYGDGNEV